MKIINPISINDTTLTLTNLAEDQLDGETILEFLPDDTHDYSEFDKTYLTSTHKVYESLVDSNIGNDPLEENSTFWVEYSATNPWRAFDEIIGSSTIGSNNIVYTFAPGGIVGGIAFFDIVDVDNIRVVMTDPGEGVVYDSTIHAYTVDNIYDWWSYFFTSTSYITNDTMLDLPPYPSATLEVTITPTIGDSASIGEIVLGQVIDLGITQYSPEISIVDYSRKTTDAFGNVTLLKRAFSKQVDVKVLMENGSINTLVELLSTLRATPVVWIATENELYESTLLVYGYYKDFRVVIPHPIWAEMNLQIEGLI